MTVHLLVATLAMVAVGFAARFPTSSDATTLRAVPTFPFSGAAAGGAQPREAAYFRSGTSLQTRASVKALTTVSDSSSVRAAGGVSPASTFSSGVASAAATSNEEDAGVKPLADQLDPLQPFALVTTRPGDTVSAIATRYGISVRTLLSNNPTVTDKNLLALGQQLVVPRADGILYKVGFGETVASIVGQYDNTSVDIVVSYRPNAIANPASLKEGNFVLLPGATIKPPPPPPPPPPARAASNGGSLSGSGGAPAPGGVGRFSMPVAVYRGVSDAFGVDRGGGTYHTGIDLDLYGYHHSNIFSACEGVVVKTEYLTYSYGYHVVVDCGDGWTTLYAHLDQINVSPGQRVSAGTVLGISGVTGFTTGEHLHFEIRIGGATVNPAAYLPF